MCGRFEDPDEESIVSTFGVEVVKAHKEPSRDVRPTQQIRIVTEDAITAQRENRSIVRELRFARWGLIPHWAKSIDPRRLLINARSETLLTKPSFRAAAKHRRAIVPAVGYYEWTSGKPGKKQPFFLHPEDQQLLGFAAVYEWWKPTTQTQISSQPEWVCSVAIITRPAADSLGHIHDRMPVVVPPIMYDDWLNPNLTNQAEVEAIMSTMPNPALTPIARSPSD